MLHSGCPRFPHIQSSSNKSIKPIKLGHFASIQVDGNCPNPHELTFAAHLILAAITFYLGLVAGCIEIKRYRHQSIN